MAYMLFAYHAFQELAAAVLFQPSQSSKEPLNINPVFFPRYIFLLGQTVFPFPSDLLNMQSGTHREQSSTDNISAHTGMVSILIHTRYFRQQSPMEQIFPNGIA